MEMILYASMTLTMADDCLLFLASQHAIAIINNMAPRSLQIEVAVEFVSETSSNKETIREGLITNARPVTPSSSAVMVSNSFILFED